MKLNKKKSSAELTEKWELISAWTRSSDSRDIYRNIANPRCHLLVESYTSTAPKNWICTEREAQEYLDGAFAPSSQSDEHDSTI